MESQKTKILLDKYWEGLTTEEEEALLRQRFRDGVHVGEDESKYGVIFDYKEGLITRQEETFDLSFLDEAAENEGYQQTPVFSIPQARNLRKWAVGLAASAIIAFFSVSYQWPRTQTLQAKSMEMDRAYTETVAALQLVADKLNEGSASIHEIGAFDKTTKQIIHEK